VRLVSPASWTSEEWVQTSIGILESWGLRVDVAAHALDRHGYCAGRDEDRLADLNDAFADPEVRAIITTRGGAGAYRIADFIDFDVVRADPKLVVGFSDITHVHLALWQHCRLGSVHGALAGPTASGTVRQLLMTSDPVTVQRDETAFSAAIRVPGRASGRLVGGNLTAMATSVGTRLPSLADAIVFFEDLRHKGLGFVDRLLTQLIVSGSLDGIAGIVLGSFEGFRDVEDRGWTIIDVLEDRLANLGVPILGGIPAGHDLELPDGSPDQVSLPIGAVVDLDADRGTITCTHWTAQSSG
jgi:muramoyltetrapeptide carboxypeptidase